MWESVVPDTVRSVVANGKARLDATRAVSPVIGIILMISITVILAAVVGIFATSTSPPEERPTTRFEFEFEDFDDSEEDRLRIIHDGGAQIGACGGSEAGCFESQEVYIVSDTAFEDDTGISGFECEDEFRCNLNFDNDGTDIGDEMTAGEAVQIFAISESDEFEEATVRIVWDDNESGQTQTLAVWEGPDA